MLITLIAVVALAPVWSHAELNIKEPLTVTITPKIWNLLDTKATLISDAVKSIELPEDSGKKNLYRYNLWDGRVEHFLVQKSGAYFQNMNNGVHLSLRDVQFRASIKGRVHIGKKIFGKWIRIARMSGRIVAKSDSANIDARLVWEDFKFKPMVTMNSKIRVDFTKNLRILNFLRKRVQRRVTSVVNNEVPKKLAALIEKKLNPALLKFKQKLTSMNITKYDVDWRIRNHALQLAIIPKGVSGIVPPVVSNDKMVCIHANLLTIMQAARTKRASFSKKLKLNETEDDRQAQQSGRLPAATAKKGITFTCLAAKADCKGLSCSYCTDVDINDGVESQKDMLKNCIPKL